MRRLIRDHQTEVNHEDTKGTKLCISLSSLCLRGLSLRSVRLALVQIDEFVQVEHHEAQRPQRIGGRIGSGISVEQVVCDFRFARRWPSAEREAKQTIDLPA